MEKVEWKNDYCIGVEEIDVQHRKLLSIVNEFYDVAVGHPADYPIKVGRCLKKLTDYTHYHFEAEEMLMERYQFPSTAQHKSEHGNFIKQVTTKIPQIASGNQVMGQELYQFLLDWIVNHIAHSDKSWADYVITIQQSPEEMNRMYRRPGAIPFFSK